MTQSRLIAMFPSLMHAGWSGFRLYNAFNGIKFTLSYSFLLFGGGAFSSVILPIGVPLAILCSFRFSLMMFDIQWNSICHATRLICPVIVFDSSRYFSFWLASGIFKLECVGNDRWTYGLLYTISSLGEPSAY